MTKKKGIYWCVCLLVVLGVWVNFFTYWGCGYPSGFRKDMSYVSEYIDCKVIIVSKSSLEQLVQGEYQVVHDERYDHKSWEPGYGDKYRVVLVWNKGPKQAWGYTKHFTAPILPPKMARPYVYEVSRASYRTKDEKVSWEAFYVAK